MTLSLGTAYPSFGGEVEASSTPTICRLPDSRRHQLWAIAQVTLSHMTQAATIDAGATLELTGADSGSITFGGATGTLVLDHSSSFTGKLINLTGNGNPSSSDQIDLKDVAFGSGTTDSYAGNSSGGVLTISDAQHHTANI